MPQAQNQTNTLLLTPSFRILIDGQPLDARLESRVLSIRAESDLEILDMFEIRFFDYDLELVNSNALDIGKNVVIMLGYQEAPLAEVANCEIVALEPEYPPDGAAYLTVRGYDRSFRLSREKKSRSFVAMKDSDIAQLIAREMNLTPVVDATSEVHPFVFQRNQANLEFLLERAQRIMYEMYIDGQNLHFRRPLSDRSEQVTLKWGESLISFSPRMSSFNQVSEVIVKGWNPHLKAEIIGKAGAGDEHALLGGLLSATQLAEAAHGATKTFKVDQPIHSLAEADALARAHFNRLSMDFITGEGRAPGNPAIKAGTVIGLEGLGDKFSGPYYVVKAIHIFNASGYSTNFEVKKNSLGRPPAPSVQRAEQALEQSSNYLDIQLVDESEQAVPGAEYMIIAPDGTRYTGTVGSDGKIHKDNLPAGECEVIFKNLENAHWAADRANCGDEIGLLVECPAHNTGDQVTMEIYRRFEEETSQKVATVNAAVNEQFQAAGAWTYNFEERDEGTRPRFIFKAKSGSLEARSDTLTVVDRLDATLRDQDGNPVAGKKYIITLPDGSTREGTTTAEGRIIEEDLPLGSHRVRLEDGSQLELS